MHCLCWRLMYRHPPSNSLGCRGVVGFRAPYFKLNGALGAALRDSGFLWDSSISGKDPGQPAAPMHAFNLSACAAAGCGNWSSLSLWCAWGAWGRRGSVAAGCACTAAGFIVNALLWMCTACGEHLADLGLHCRREVPAYTLPTNGKGTQAYRRVDPAPLPGMPVLEVGGRHGTNTCRGGLRCRGKGTTAMRRLACAPDAPPTAVVSCALTIGVHALLPRSACKRTLSANGAAACRSL